MLVCQQKHMIVMADDAIGHAVDHKCMIRISTTGPADLTSWHEMWEAASAIYGMCLRFNRFGKAEGIGMLRTKHFCYAVKADDVCRS